jgi:hypothetical protein
MAKRKITGREVLKDIKAGMDDPALMEKYKLSAQGLQSVFMKLVNAGVLSQAELDARVPVSERTVEVGLYICPACGNIQAKEFTQCSRCGFIAPSHLKQQKEKEEREKAASKSPARKPFARAQTSDVRTKLDAVNAAEQDYRKAEEAPTGPPINLAATIRYCNWLAFAALAAYVLVIVGLLAIIQTSPAAEFFTALQLLLGTLVLGLPALIMGLIVFLAVRALTESVRAFSEMFDQLQGNKP